MSETASSQAVEINRTVAPDKRLRGDDLRRSVLESIASSQSHTPELRQEAAERLKKA